MNPVEQLLRQQKTIPHRKANHRECTGLPFGSTGKRDKEGTATSGAQGGTVKTVLQALKAYIIQQ